MTLVSGDLADYLVSDPVIDYEDAGVAALARALRAEHTDDAAFAAAALLLLERKFAAVALAGLGLGLAAVALHTLWDHRPDACEMLLPPRSCGGAAELRIADPRVSSGPAHA